MAGRPTKLTDALSARIILTIRAGNYLETAAAVNGIGESTLHSWLEKGRRGRRPYVEFLESVEKARAASEAAALKVIKDAMPENWQAAAWYLERSRPDRWGKRIDLRIQREHILEDTRRLAVERGLDPDVAVKEVEVLLLGAPTR